MRRRQLLALSVLAPFALAACGSPGSEAATTGTTGTQGFSYSPKGYDDLTIELDRPAERIAMDFYSAAALAPYGIKPVAVYGFGQNESPGKSFDQTGVEVVGTDMEFDLEALAATNPDIIIAYGNDKGDGWTWWDDKLKDQVAKLVPFVPVKLDGGTPEDMFAQYAAIAQALGRDTETGEIAQQRKAFDAARQRIRDITADKDWLTVLLANFSPEINYTAKKLGVAKMLTDDGLNLVGPESGKDTSWAEVSWEKMSDYPADVILVHDASTDYEDNPIFKSLPPVKHKQLGTWDDKRAYTYDGYTDWLGELADVLEEAKDINKD
ncbi:iron complex transport system substrate-binding protein [Brevibacterium sp. 239c]|uniref:ABC transporter substrate-binding protein n=2 Tax=unclassified Brevibacterium TaxID=2614124 RepID=UPI000C5B8BF7|nr:ABC transporter substrate-binding protein [Brevibacterium sp. 239c]SMX86858.1 iron complex transport system substrate-binding protein [Brevibacterium sp. 239c]